MNTTIMQSIKRISKCFKNRVYELITMITENTTNISRPYPRQNTADTEYMRFTASAIIGRSHPVMQFE